MGRATLTSLALAATVAGATLLLGIGLAALVSCREFPGRRALEGLLILPLAFPGYVLGFVWLGLLEFTGPIQTLLRDFWGDGAPSFSARKFGVLAFVLTLSLYPYVYLPARAALLGRSSRLLEAARSLGTPERALFFRVSWPLILPSALAGLQLVVLETLSDYGTVALFNQDTWTTAIVKSWHGLFSLATAAQLAWVLLLATLGVSALLRWISVGRSLATRDSGQDAPERKPFLGWARWVAFGFGVLPFLFGFAIPVAQLLIWASNAAEPSLSSGGMHAAWNSFRIGGLATGATLGLSILLASSARFGASDDRLRGAIRFFIVIATLGYAIPGAVMAVATFSSIYALGAGVGTTLATSPLLLLFALATRFLRVGYEPLNAAWSRIPRSLDDASNSLGHSRISTVARIHVPLLAKSAAAAAILLFVDLVKEMPIQLMTRPSGWDSLSVRIFQFTSEGQWAEAALPALLLVAVSCLPLGLVWRSHGH